MLADEVTIITISEKFCARTMKFFGRTCALLAVPFERWQREEIGEVRRGWSKTIVTEHEAIQPSDSSPRKRFSSVTAKYTRRARRATKLKSFHSTRYRNIVPKSLSHLSRLGNFKLKIIHWHHMCGCSEYVKCCYLFSLFPTPHITISASLSWLRTGGNFCCFAFNCDGK